MRKPSLTFETFVTALAVLLRAGTSMVASHAEPVVEVAEADEDGASSALESHS